MTIVLANEPEDTLGGTLSTTASDGVATFSGLILTRAATGYTILISSDGLSGAATNPITVTPGAASQVVLTKQPPGSVMQEIASACK